MAHRLAIICVAKTFTITCKGCLRTLWINYTGTQPLVLLCSGIIQFLIVFPPNRQPVILLDWDSESDTTVHVIVSVISKFRELPELAKHFVMRTLFAEQPLPETLVSAWVKKDHQK